MKFILHRVCVPMICHKIFPIQVKLTIDWSEYDTWISWEMQRTVYLVMFLYGTRTPYSQIENGKFWQIGFMFPWFEANFIANQNGRRYFQGKRSDGNTEIISKSQKIPKRAHTYTHVVKLKVKTKNKKTLIRMLKRKQEMSSHNQITISDIIRNSFGISQKINAKRVKNAKPNLKLTR